MGSVEGGIPGGVSSALKVWNQWILLLAATAPVAVLHILYHQGVGNLWRLLEVLAAILGAGACVLTAHRFFSRRWFGLLCGLMAITAVFLGGYANVFSDRPSLFSLAHTAGEGIQVLPAWLLFLPWTLLVVGPGAVTLSIWLALRTTKAHGALLVGLWAAWAALQGTVWIYEKGDQPFRTTRHRSIAGFWVSSAADAFVAYRSWDDSGLVRAVEEDAVRNPPRSILFKECLSNKILVIQLESLDAKAVGWKHQGRLVLPFLTNLSEHCPYVLMDPNHFGPSGSSGAEFQLLTGFRPVAPKPAFSLNRMDWKRVGLPWALRAKGYTALAFHGNDGNYWNRREPFLAAGINQFFEKKDILEVPDQKWGVSDRALFQKVSKELLSHNEPVFAFVITMSSHAPFDYASSGFLKNDGMLSRYFNSINYLDSELRLFFSDFSKFENWTILMYGDHASMIRAENYDCLFDGKELVPLWMFKIKQKKIIELKNNEYSEDKKLELIDLNYSIKINLKN